MDERIRELFAAMLEVAPTEVTETTSPATLARWDSMRHLILVSGFEEEFGIDVDPEEAVEMYRDYATFRKAVWTKIEHKTSGAPPVA